MTLKSTVNYTYGDSQWGDLLTAYDGNTITYDGIGNPLNDGTWTYTWQHGRQLASMSKADKTWTYTYNADGLRAERTDGTDTYRYVYDGSQLILMEQGGLRLRLAYTPEGTPLSIVYKNETYYYVTNLQGDVTAILSQNGYKMVEYTYDAWGNVLSITGPLKDSLGQYNPLRYRGYVYDHETGLYYLQSRYYNPKMGRFINMDAFASTGQGLLSNNTFAYCLNNPINYVDSTGSFPWALVIIGACALGGLIYGATTDRNLADEIYSQQEETLDLSSPPAPPPPPRYGPDSLLSNQLPKPSDTVLSNDIQDTTPTNNSQSQNTTNTLTTTDRINNVVIGTSFGLFVGGSVVLLGGTIACVAGSASILVPVLGVTGKQAVAWGLLAYDVLPIFIAPFLGMEMEALEYPS